VWYVSCSFTVTVYYFTIYFESDVVVSLVSSGIAQDERASFTVHVHLPVVGFHREKVRLYYQQNREKVLLRMIAGDLLMRNKSSPCIFAAKKKLVI